MPTTVMFSLEDEEPFEIMGIRTALSNHQFIYKCNAHFKTLFSRIEDLDVKIDERIRCFPMYMYDSDFYQTEFFLIQNQSIPSKEVISNSLFNELYETSLLLPKHDKYNFLFKFHLDFKETVLNTLSLKPLPFVQSMAILPGLKQVEKNRFIL